MIDVFGRLMLAIAVVAMLLAAGRAAFAGQDRGAGLVRPATAGTSQMTTPAEAIERAVAQRVGGRATVTVTGLETTVAPERALHAMPEPGGRAGAPMRFVLMVGRVRRGVALATVTVVASYARAARAIGRNEA